MEPILITGADGFIGPHLLRAKPGFRPILHVRTAGSRRRWHDHGFPDVVMGDLSEGQCLNDAPPVAAVIHLAGRSTGSARELYESNVAATAALLDWMIEKSVPHLVLASTGAVYPDRGDRPSRESDTPDPASHYGLSKWAAELAVCRAVATSGGKLSATILRFPHVYGPGNRKGVVWNFMDSAVRTGTVLLDGEGTQERDFLYVDDAVSAILVATCARRKAPGVITLNIAAGSKTSLTRLGTLISQALETSIAFRPSGRPEQPPRCLWVDPEAARAGLNWTASVGLPAGLKKTAAWRLSLDGEAPRPGTVRR